MTNFNKNYIIITTIIAFTSSGLCEDSKGVKTMGKTTNRVLSTVLTVLMILSMVSVFVLPASAETESAVSDAFNLDYQALYNGENTYLINGEWNGQLTEDATLTFTFQGRTYTETYNAKRHFAKFTDAYKAAYDEAFREGKITADNFFDYVPCFIFAKGTYTENLGIHTSAIVLGANAGISPNAEQGWTIDEIKANGGLNKNAKRGEETVLPAINLTSRTLAESGTNKGDYALTPASGDGAQWIALRETAYEKFPDKRQTLIVDGVTVSSSISVRGHDQNTSYSYGEMAGTVKRDRSAQVYANNVIGSGDAYLFAGTDGSYFRYDVEAKNLRAETAYKAFFERHYVVNTKITDSYFTNFANTDYGFFKAYGPGDSPRVTGGEATIENCIFYNMDSIPFKFNVKRGGATFNFKNNILYNLNAGAFEINNENKNVITLNITGNLFHQDGDMVSALIVSTPRQMLGGKTEINFNGNKVTGNIANVAPVSSVDLSVSGTLYYNFDQNFFGETKTSEGKTIAFPEAPEGAIGNTGWDHTNTNYYYDYNFKYLSHGLEIESASGFGEGNVVEIIGDRIIARCFKNLTTIRPVIVARTFEGATAATYQISEDKDFTTIVDEIDLSKIKGEKDYYVRLMYEGTSYQKEYSLKIVATQPKVFNEIFNDNKPVITIGTKTFDYSNTAVYVEKTDRDENGNNVAYGYIGDTYYSFVVDNDVVFTDLQEITVKVKNENRNIILPSGEYGDLDINFPASFYGSNIGIDAVDEGSMDDGSDWRLNAKWGAFGETGVGTITVEDGAEGTLSFEGITMRGQFVDVSRQLGNSGVTYGALDITFKNVVVDQNKNLAFSDKRSELAASNGIGDATSKYLFNLNNARSANHNDKQVEDTGLGFTSSKEYAGFGESYADSFTLDSVYIKNTQCTPKLLNDYVPATVVINQLYRDAEASFADTLIGNIKTGAANKNCSFTLTNSNIRNDGSEKGTSVLMSILGTCDEGSLIAEGISFDVVITNNVFYDAVTKKGTTNMFVVAPAYVSSIDFSNNFVYQTAQKNLVVASSYVGDAASSNIQLVGNTRFYGNNLIGFAQNNVALSLGMSKNPELDETFMTEDFENFRTGFKGTSAASMGSNNYYYDYDRTVGNNAVGITSLTKTDKVISAEFSNPAKTIDLYLGAEASLADITLELFDGVSGKWYDGETEITDVSTLTADSIYGIKKISFVVEKQHGDLTITAKYTVTIYVSEVKSFANETFNHEYYSNNAVIVTDKATNLATGDEFIAEWNGTFYTFIAGVNAFESYDKVSANATEILLQSFDSSKDITITKPIKIYGENFNLNPVVVGEQGATTTQYGKDWGYNSAYTAKELKVNNLTIASGVTGTVSVYGITIKNTVNDNARSTGPVNLTLTNVRFLGESTYNFNLGNSYNSSENTSSFTVKNAYINFISSGSAKFFNGETANPNITFDTCYLNGHGNFANVWLKYPSNKNVSFTIKNSYVKDVNGASAQAFTPTGYYQSGTGGLAGAVIPSGYSNVITFENNVFSGFTGNNRTHLINVYADSYSKFVIKDNYVEPASGVSSISLFYSPSSTFENDCEVAITGNVFNGMSDMVLKSAQSTDTAKDYKWIVKDNFVVTNRVADVYADGVFGTNHKNLLTSGIKSLDYSYNIFPGGLGQDKINEYEFSSDVKVDGQNLSITAYNGTGIAAKVDGGYKLDLSLLIAKNDYFNPIAVKYQGSDDMDILDEITVATDSDTLVFELNVYSVDKSVSDKYTLTITVKDEPIPSFKNGYQGDFFSKDAVLVDSAITETSGDIVRRWDGTAYTFTVGVNAFKTIAEAYASPNFKDDIFVLSIANSASTTLEIKKGSRVFSPAWNIAPMKEMNDSFNAIASDGKEWTTNDAYAQKTIEVKNLMYTKTMTGTAEVYGFTVNNVIAWCGGAGNYRSPDMNNPITTKFINGQYKAPTNALFYYRYANGANNNDTVVIKNVYMNGAKNFEYSNQGRPHMPAHVVLDGFYYDISGMTNENFFQSKATDSSVTIRNSYIKGTSGRRFCISHNNNLNPATATRVVTLDNNVFKQAAAGGMLYMEPHDTNKLYITNNYMDKTADGGALLIDPSSATTLGSRLTGTQEKELVFEGNKIIGYEKSFPSGFSFEFTPENNFVTSATGDAAKTAVGVQLSAPVGGAGAYYVDYNMTAYPDTVSDLEFAATENVVADDSTVEIKGVTDTVDLATIVSKVPGHNTVATIAGDTETAGLTTVSANETVKIKVYSNDKSNAKEYTVKFVDEFTHTFTNYVFNNDSTCIVNGTETAHCDDADCNATHTRVKPNSTSDHNYKVVGFDGSVATCQHNGLNLLECKNEGCDWTGSVEKANSTVDHVYENYQLTTPATCASAGYETGYCKWCDAADERINPDKYPANDNHSWNEWKYDGNTTCIATGTDSRQCSVCESIQTRTSSVVSNGTQHSFGEYVYNKDATCVKDGTKTAKCTVCSNGTHTVIDTDHLKETVAHVFTNYVYNNDATTQKDGTKTAKCDRHVIGCTATSTITATGTKLPTVEQKPEKPLVDTTKVFTDVKADDWFKSYVDFAYTNGIFSGFTTTTFSPYTNMTRAQFVQVLANLSNIDTTNKAVATKFADVKSGEWYTPAIKWASETGIVNGIGDGMFAPDQNVTREQMCVMLVNYVEKYKNQTLKKAVSASVFADDANISSWAKEAVYKCADAGIIKGVGNNMFAPKDYAQRSHGATLFTNFYKDYLA